MEFSLQGCEDFAEGVLHIPCQPTFQKEAAKCESGEKAVESHPTAAA
jgi:hypothetical protein